jgi:predicted transcriptional regulator
MNNYPQYSHLTNLYNLSYNYDNIEIMNDIITQLQKFGLGDHEARVYSVLLETSPANATLIAKKCALSRSSVYTTLTSLIAKGLVGTTSNELETIT